MIEFIILLEKHCFFKIETNIYKHIYYIYTGLPSFKCLETHSLDKSWRFWSVIIVADKSYMAGGTYILLVLIQAYEVFHQK